ncbi:MAG: aldo/keto reductase [Myxococcota bacterium]|nr:aldo/keto reductase [Myxococcota bacterium]
MPHSLVDSEPRKIGPELRTGPLAFGCWRLVAMSVKEARQRVETALEAGLGLVDNADVYGLDWGGSGFGAAESLLGEVLADGPGLRGQMILATKGGIIPGTPYDSSAAYLEEACNASLTRLGVDHVDLYQIHRPDLFAHPDEVAAGLTRLHESGKVREVGVSNYTPAQTEALAAALSFPLATSQPEISALELSALRDGTLDLCARLRITALAWSPLAGGRLASGEGVRPELLAVLDDLAKREGVDRATLCTAFVLAFAARPIAIVGTTNPERIAAAPRALEVRLDRADVYRIVEASEGAPLP